MECGLAYDGRKIWCQLVTKFSQQRCWQYKSPGDVALCCWASRLHHFKGS